MKHLAFSVVNVLSNIGVLLVCPFLVLAWIVRVYLLERRKVLARTLAGRGTHGQWPFKGRLHG